MCPVPETPDGHGELVLDPPFDRWVEAAQSSARAAQEWDFRVGGWTASSVREGARRLLTAEAHTWTDRLGVSAAVPGADPGLVVATGHQPEFYHAGVWVKVFLLQRIARSLDATAVDVVVDSDSFGDLGVTVPRLDRGVERATHVLAQGGIDACYACIPAPDRDTVVGFCAEVEASLSTLPVSSIARHFATYADSLLDSVAVGGNLAQLMTAARRRYEGAAADYLELPVTVASRSEPYARFVIDIALSARRFAEAHNEELASHRVQHGVRSAVHPFPDLAIGSGEVELPFWLLDRGVRSAVRVREAGSEVEIVGPRGPVASLPSDPDRAVHVLAESGALLVPRALTLTLFIRMFLADLFIHGTGGASYDRVTERVARRWWGVDLPPAVTATLTMHLPLGLPVVTDEDVSALDQRLHRLAHNPDELVDDVAFDTPAHQERARELGIEKRALVEAISAEGADRKALGLTIRAVNAELTGLLEGLAEELRQERDTLAAQRAASDVLTDRTYPFCLFSPDDILDTIG